MVEHLVLVFTSATLLVLVAEIVATAAVVRKYQRKVRSFFTEAQQEQMQFQNETRQALSSLAGATADIVPGIVEKLRELTCQIEAGRQNIAEHLEQVNAATSDCLARLRDSVEQKSNEFSALVRNSREALDGKIEQSRETGIASCKTVIDAVNLAQSAQEQTARSNRETLAASLDALNAALGKMSDTGKQQGEILLQRHQELREELEKQQRETAESLIQLSEHVNNLFAGWDSLRTRADEFQNRFEAMKRTTAASGEYLNGRLSEIAESVGALQDEIQSPEGSWTIQNDLEDLASSDDPIYSVAVLGTMSAGKSTLLNSIIGKDLLPSRNEACTATVFQVEDYDKLSDFVARATDRENTSTEWRSVTRNTLEEWNGDKKLQRIEIRGNLPNISNIAGKYRVMFFDIPGPNNSLEEGHAEIVDKILRKADYCAMLCVLNASLNGVDDERELLSHIKEVSEKRKLDIQMAFIINKIDLLDMEKGENPVGLIHRTKADLEKLRFHSPLILPVSSESSLLLRTALKEKVEMTLSEATSENGASSATRFKSALSRRQQENLRIMLNLYRSSSAEYEKMYSSFPELRPIFEFLRQKRYPFENRQIKIAGEYFTVRDLYQTDLLTGIPLLESILKYHFNRHVHRNAKQTAKPIAS